MISAIEDRRSVRQYADRPVPRELVRQVLQAGILAPSAGNRQPWKFLVLGEKAKTELLAAMQRGLQQELDDPMLGDSAQTVQNARHTLSIMQAASVLVLIHYPAGRPLTEPLDAAGRVREICDMQSIGAAIENMALQATALGLGSLWIGHIFWAHRALQAWLGRPGELCAVLALGWPAKNSPPRPRKAFEDVVEWLD